MFSFFKYVIPNITELISPSHKCNWQCEKNRCEIYESNLAKWRAKADTMTKDEIAEWDFQRGVYYGYIDKDHYKIKNPDDYNLEN